MNDHNGTSLQQLLSLDKESKDVDTQLQNAARIAGLPPQWDQITQSDREKYQPHHGRAEWVLKWLLDKLRSSESSGQYVRSLPRAWILIRYMIRLVPASNASVLLNKAMFISILQRTFEENLPSTYQPLPSHNPQDGEGNSQDRLESSDIIESTSRPKKRKRSAPSTESKKTVKPITGEHSTPNGLLKAIIDTVELIISESKDSLISEANASGEHMKSVLRTDTANCACLLRTWIETLYAHFFSNSGSQDDHQISILQRSLSAILTIWELGVHDVASSPGITASIFSQECVVSIVLLLEALVAVEESGSTFKHLKQCIKILEELLARYLWLPARIEYFAEKESDIKSSSQDHTFTKNPGKYIQTLQLTISALLQSNHDCRTKMIFSTVPLFSVAIRSSSRKSAKKRIREAPWLEAVFVSLVSSIGCNIFEEQIIPPPQASIEALERMTSIACNFQVTLNTTMLKEITWRYTGLSESNPTTNKLNLGLLGKIISLDSDVFLTEYTPLNSGDMLPSIDFSKILFSILSNTFLVSNKTSQWNLIEDSIVLPILRASASSRQLFWFLTRWDEQLMLTIRNQEKQNEKSIWERPNLSRTLRNVLESSLPLTQISALFEEHKQRIEVLTERGTDIANTLSLVSTRASIVFVDVLLDAIRLDETVDKLKTQLKNLELVLSSIVKNEKYNTLPELWRVWKSLSRLHDLLSPFQETVFSQLLLLDHAVQCVNDGFSTSKYYLEGAAIEAFSYTLNICSYYLHRRLNHEVVVKAVSNVASILSEPFSPNLQDLEKLKKRRKEKDSTKKKSSSSSLILWASAILVRFPDLIEFIPSREIYFMRLFWNSFLERHVPNFADEHPVNITWSIILDAVSEFALSLASVKVRNDLLSTYYRAITRNISADFNDELQEQLFRFAEELYLQAPSGSLLRKHREPVLDCLLKSLQKVTLSLNISDLKIRLSLMVHLMEASNFSSSLSSDPTGLFQVARFLQHSIIPLDEDCLTIFDELVSRTLSHIALNMEPTPRKAYLDGFRRSFKDYIHQNDSFLNSVPTLRLVNTSYYVIADFDLKQETEAQHRYLEVLLNSLEETLQKPNEIKELELNAILLVLSRSLDYVKDRDAWRKRLNKAFLRWRKKTEKKGMDLANSTRIKVNDLEAKLTHGSTTNSSLEETKKLIVSGISPLDRMKVLNSTRDFFDSISMPHRIKIAQHLIDEEETSPNSGNLQVLDTLLSSFSSKGDDTVRHEGANFLGRICLLLPQAHDLVAFHGVMDCLDTIILEKTWLITQFGIDSLVSSFITVLSPSGPDLPATAADMIYTRLCTTLRTLLSLHRTKVGGRMHLLLPLLQSLLACLFIPDIRPNYKERTKLPPWINSYTDPLSSTQAALYTRLLNSLCDPSLSSVSDHRAANGTNHLTDEKAKARRYTGQYIQIVLTKYISLVLSGRLPDSNTRAALMPGIWTALDVLDEDGARAMSAGLDSRASAVWKGLWAEWKRFGKK